MVDTPKAEALLVGLETPSREPAADVATLAAGAEEVMAGAARDDIVAVAGFAPPNKDGLSEAAAVDGIVVAVDVVAPPRRLLAGFGASELGVLAALFPVVENSPPAVAVVVDGVDEAFPPRPENRLVLPPAVVVEGVEAAGLV